MTSDFEREQQLRRLLSEAVEPVEPAAGAQTRLLARARAQAQRKSGGPLILRWGVPVGLASLAIVVVVTLAFAINRGGGSNSSASTSAGSATAKAPVRGPADAAQASAGPSTAGGEKRSASNATPASPQLESGKSATTYSGAAPNAATTDLAPGQLSTGVGSQDLDGDGTLDLIALQGGSLVVPLSQDGVQRVTLPPPVGSGARVLGVRALSDPNGKAVTVVFVRLTEAGSAATDTIVAVVKGRLTVLRQGSGPVLLTIDPTHGYGCNQRSLVVAGNTTPFVVDGSALVASPELRGVVTPPAKVTGCF